MCKGTELHSAQWALCCKKVRICISVSAEFVVLVADLDFVFEFRAFLISVSPFLVLAFWRLLESLGAIKTQSSQTPNAFICPSLANRFLEARAGQHICQPMLHSEIAVWVRIAVWGSIGVGIFTVISLSRAQCTKQAQYTDWVTGSVAPG